MLQLGLLALGAFVGTVSTFGLKYVDGFSSFGKATTIILSSALGGVALVFIQQFQERTIVGAYCIGLLIALLWVYIPGAIRNIQSQARPLNILGWLHLFGVVLMNLVALSLVLPPAYREVWSQSPATHSPH